MKILNILLICSLLWGCSASKLVTYEVDENADFSQYKTYAFPGIKLEQEDLFRKNRLDMIITAIDNEMSSRGYIKKDDNADLLLNVGIVVEERVQTRTTDIRERPVYMGQRNYHWEAEEVEVGRYNVGTITMDVVDVETNQMIWYGVVERVVTEIQEDEKAKARIDDVVNTMFEKFPVKPMGK